MREFTLKNNAIVSINSWAAGVREAYGVTGAGQVCVTEEKAEFVILTMVFRVIK